MGLKESGLRGSLRNVSVGIVAIPDDVTDQLPLDEGSGTTAANAVSNRDFGIEGASWKSGSDGRGGHYLSTDGVDDRLINTDDVEDFGGLTSWSFSVWIEATEPSDRAHIIRIGDDDLLTATDSLAWGSFYNEREGTLTAKSHDGSNRDEVEVDEGEFFDAGINQLGVRWEANNTMDIIKNGSVIQSESVSNVSEVGIGDMDTVTVAGPGGGSDRFLDADFLDEVSFGLDEFWSESTFLEIYDSHPSTS